MIYEFKFPDIGEGVHEGKVLQLKVKPGDKVEAGEILAVVETDKVVAELPAPKDGILDKFGVEEGQIIEVGQVLAFIKVEGEVGSEEKKSSKDKKDESQKPKTMAVEEDGATVVGQLELAGDSILPASGEGVGDRDVEAIGLVPGKNKVLATPAARKLASDLDVDIASIKGTGPGGRVMKEDIRSTAKTQPQKDRKDKQTDQPENESIQLDQSKTKTRVASGDAEVISMSTMRRTIAENMEISNAIPAAVTQDFGVIDELVAYRNEINQNRKTRISFQPLLMKGVAAALRKYPMLNSTFDASKKEITIHPSVNMGFAVDTEHGLMVPVLKQLERMSILEIDETMRELVQQAKERTIDLEDLRDGTISITNYGPFGGTYGRPMILPPQTAIIGFGRIQQVPVVKQNMVAPGWILPISITFDHRVVDGATVGLFVTEMLQLLSSPKTLLLAV
jgi:pyruvate dehydrogenase E2 component (dihydrolipoamide acetyltransferase)